MRESIYASEIFSHFQLIYLWMWVHLLINYKFKHKYIKANFSNSPYKCIHLEFQNRKKIFFYWYFFLFNHIYVIKLCIIIIFKWFRLPWYHSMIELCNTNVSNIMNKYKGKIAKILVFSNIHGKIQVFTPSLIGKSIWFDLINWVITTLFLNIIFYKSKNTT